MSLSEPVQQFILNETFHLLVIPAAIFISHRLGLALTDKARNFVIKSVTESIKSELSIEIRKTLGPLFDKAFMDRTPQLKRMVEDIEHQLFKERVPQLELMMREANDELLEKINGTYAKSGEQAIRDKNVKERLDLLEQHRRAARGKTDGD